MGRGISVLKCLNLEAATPFDVKRLITDIPIPFIPYRIPKGFYILRARKGCGYTKCEEMTYCPVEACTTIQRASLPGQTMFYGAIADIQGHQENARAIVMAECSELCRNGITSVGREYFSVGMWEVVEPIRVISFVTSSTYPEIKDNCLLNQLRDNYDRLCTVLDDREISEFICQEFIKTVNREENYKYLISATISTYITNDEKYDGVIYPSVQMSGQCGLNVALTPNAADKKLRFDSIINQVLYKKEAHIILNIESTTKDGKTENIHQYKNLEIEQQLGIDSVESLPQIV